MGRRYVPGPAGPGMTGSDRLRDVHRSGLHGPGMIRPDYRPPPRHAQTPRSAPPDAVVPVRRPLARAGDAARRSSRQPAARGCGSRSWVARRVPARAAWSASSSRTPTPAGALVLYGACDAVVQRPYRPFVEALDQLARTTDPAVLRAELGENGGELSRLLPDLPQRVGGLAVPVAGRPGHRAPPAAQRDRRPPRRALSRRTPLVVVLEDGHWADPPTLLLLRHLARGAVDVHGARPHDVPRHGGGGAGDAVRRARRPPPVGGRRAAAAGRAQCGGDRRVRRPRRGRGARRAARRRRSRAARADRRQRVPHDRAVADAARFRCAVGRRLAHRRARRSRQSRGGARGGRPAPGPTRHGHDRRPRAGGRRRSRVRPRGGRAGRARARAGRRPRDDRGGPGAPARLPVHARARAQGAVRPDAAPAARGAAPARRRGARARPRPGQHAQARRSRASLRRGRAHRRTRPCDRVRAAGRPRGDGDARVRRGRGALRHRARARHDRRSAASRRPTSSSAPRASGEAGRAAPSRPTGPPRRSLATSATPSCSPRPRSGSRTPAGARRSSTRARSSCCSRRPTRSRTRTRRCASWSSPAWPARTTSSATPPAGIRPARRPWRWRGASTTGPASPRSSCARTGRATSATSRTRSTC